MRAIATNVITTGLLKNVSAFLHTLSPGDGNQRIRIAIEGAGFVPNAAPALDCAM
jgi:hypothetical protein